MEDDKVHAVINSLDLTSYPCSMERLTTAISLFLSGKITEEGFFKFLGRKTEFEISLIDQLKKLRQSGL